MATHKQRMSADIRHLRSVVKRKRFGVLVSYMEVVTPKNLGRLNT